MTPLRIPFFLALHLASILSCAGASAEPALQVRIVLVGDSTVTDKGGWGGEFAKLLKAPAVCVNLARSGSSSKSYYDQGHWQRALAQKPDYVLIQFGHNDQPGKGPQRETDAKTTYRDYLKKYLVEARAAGARPILVTSLVRRNFTPDGKIDSNLAPYADAMKQLATEEKVPLVDLHDRSRELVERLGPDKVQAFGPPHPKLPGQFDNTHLSAAGAKAIAPLVAAELWDAEPNLRRCLPEKKAQ